MNNTNLTGTRTAEMEEELKPFNVVWKIHSFHWAFF